MSTLPTTTARSSALAAQGKYPVIILELVTDICNNAYGHLPCTATGATGTECYNTYATCQAKNTYVKTSKTIRFVSRGVTSPLGKTGLNYVTSGYMTIGYVQNIDAPLRPLLLSTSNAPTVLDFENGLATRNNISVMLGDETDNDSDQDPYFATRSTAAKGTYWQRWIARNANYFGRTAKIRRGFVASPWDWTTFIDEQYIIDSILINNSNQVQITLKDPFKIVDNTTIPLPTTGTLQAITKAVEQAGLATAGAASSITFDSSASAVNGYYTGMEVYVYLGTGAGQRRYISGYTGATRIATVSVAWSVNPDTTSAFQVSALSVDVGAGNGSQYTDPATSGKNEYVRIGSEIIRYTSKSGTLLSWTDSTYRAQFGTTKADHAIGDTIQLCRGFVGTSIQSTLTSLMTENGIPSSYIGASLASECSVWYGSSFNITACISTPEKPTSLIRDILNQIDACMWWSPQTQSIEFKAIMPSSAAYPTWSDSDTLIKGGTTMTFLDTLRITQQAISYNLRDATAVLTQPSNYQRTDVTVDLAAQSSNEYGDVRPSVLYSRWFNLANATGMAAATTRMLSRLRNAPKLFTIKIDPKDYTLSIGSIVGIKTYKNTDSSGNPKLEPCFIISSMDFGTHIEIQARSTNFNFRSAYIAPAADPDYPTEQVYAHIASAGGNMANGDVGYSII